MIVMVIVWKYGQNLEETIGALRFAVGLNLDSACASTGGNRPNAAALRMYTRKAPYILGVFLRSTQIAVGHREISAFSNYCPRSGPARILTPRSMQIEITS